MAGNSPQCLRSVYPDLAILARADYRETAAKFQKEWHVKEPHRHFDFAPHVKSHALVSVINRGLVYHSLERQYAQRKVCFMIHASVSLASVAVGTLTLCARELRQSPLIISSRPGSLTFASACARLPAAPPCRN